MFPLHPPLMNLEMCKVLSFLARSLSSAPKMCHGDALHVSASHVTCKAVLCSLKPCVGESVLKGDLSMNVEVFSAVKCHACSKVCRHDIMNAGTSAAECVYMTVQDTSGQSREKGTE